MGNREAGDSLSLVSPVVVRLFSRVQCASLVNIYPLLPLNSMAMNKMDYQLVELD